MQRGKSAVLNIRDVGRLIKACAAGRVSDQIVAVGDESAAHIFIRAAHRRVLANQGISDIDRAVSGIQAAGSGLVCAFVYIADNSYIIQIQCACIIVNARRSKITPTASAGIVGDGRIGDTHRPTVIINTRAESGGIAADERVENRHRSAVSNTAAAEARIFQDVHPVKRDRAVIIINAANSAFGKGHPRDSHRRAVCNAKYCEKVLKPAIVLDG